MSLFPKKVEYPFKRFWEVSEGKCTICVLRGDPWFTQIRYTDGISPMCWFLTQHLPKTFSEGSKTNSLSKHTSKSLVITPHLAQTKSIPPKNFFAHDPTFVWLTLKRQTAYILWPTEPHECRIMLHSRCFYPTVKQMLI